MVTYLGLKIIVRFVILAIILVILAILFRKNIAKFFKGIFFREDEVEEVKKDKKK